MRSWLTFLLIAGLVAAIAIYSWFVFNRLRPDPYRRTVLLVFSADIDGDRQPEQLRLFSAPLGSRYSVLAARDGEGRLLWEANVPPVRQFTSDKRLVFVQIKDRLALATRQFVPDPARSRHAHQVSLLSLRNGQRLWTFELPKTEKWGLYLTVLTDGERLYVVSQDPKGHIVRSLNLETGAVTWQTRLVRAPRTPVFQREHLIFFHGSQIAVLRLEDGVARILPALDPPLEIAGSYYHRIWRPDGKGTDLVRLTFPALEQKPASFADAPLRLGSDCLLARHGAWLISGCAAHDRIIELTLWPLGGPRDVNGELLPKRTIQLPQGYFLPEENDLWRDYDPNGSPFFDVRTRYLPLIIWQRTIDEFQRKRISQRLWIVDLESGREVWLSAAFRYRTFEHWGHALIYRDGRYYLRFNYQLVDGRFFRSVLVFDGHRGRFSGAFHLRVGLGGFAPPTEGFNFHVFPWMIDRDFYSVQFEGYSVTIDVRSLAIAIAEPPNVEVVDALPLVELVLGRLP